MSLERQDAPFGRQQHTEWDEEKQEKLTGEEGLSLVSKGTNRKAGKSDEALVKCFIHKPKFY